ncbi:hypothetical protein GYB59_02070 [bacterium]|nr:hypothetical protein [bacterium]
MPILTERDWRGLVKTHGAAGTARLVENWLGRSAKGESGGITTGDFSYHALIEGTVEHGREFINAMNPRYETSSATLEAIGGVSMTAFSTITKAFLSNRVMARKNKPGYRLQQLIPTVNRGAIEGEKVPAAAVPAAKDAVRTVGEFGEYPMVGMQEDYVEPPDGEKTGLRMGISKEAIYFDRPRVIMQQADNIGDFVYETKERNIAKVVAGVKNTYRRQGTLYNTYLTSGKWINDQANPMVNYTDVQESRDLFRNMRDFNTQEKVVIVPTQLLVSEYMLDHVDSILKARYNQKGDGASNTIVTVYNNPVAGRYTADFAPFLEEEIIAAGLANSTQVKDWWFHGNFAEAFEYLEHWPVTVERLGRDSEAAFTNDIVMQFKASERGVANVKDPQHTVRNKHEG